jgi:hypothetical protein
LGGRNPKKSKLHSQINWEQIKLKGNLLSLGPVLFSARAPSKNTNTNINTTIIFFYCFPWLKIWFLPLGDGNRLHITLTLYTFLTTGNLQRRIFWCFKVFHQYIYLYKYISKNLCWYKYSNHQDVRTWVVNFTVSPCISIH